MPPDGSFPLFPLHVTSPAAVAMPGARYLTDEAQTAPDYGGSNGPARRCYPEFSSIPTRSAEAQEVCTARRVAVGHEVGDLNRPEPTTGSDRWAVECTDPGEGRAVRGYGGLPTGTPYGLARFAEWGVAAPRPFPDRRHPFPASGAVKAEERSVP
jgi:hypothetical protein